MQALIAELREQRKDAQSHRDSTEQQAELTNKAVSLYASLFWNLLVVVDKTAVADQRAWIL